MTTLSNPRAGAHGFDEFAAVIEGDLLRAAWLLTADRVRATEVTEVALGRVLAGWSRQPGEPPPHARLDVRHRGARRARVGTWWLRRPFVGDATLGDSLLSARARATGQLFRRLQGCADAPFGVGTTSTAPLGGDKPPSEVQLRKVGTTPQVALDGKAVTLRRSAWGDYLAALPPVRYEDGMEVPVTMVVAQVPSDTDACWPATTAFSIDQGEPSGIELRDHSTYAVTTVVGVGSIAGTVWRTASQQVGINTGKRASMAVYQDLLLVLLPKAGLWGAISADDPLTATMNGHHRCRRRSACRRALAHRAPTGRHSHPGAPHWRCTRTCCSCCCR